MYIQRHLEQVIHRLKEKKSVIVLTGSRQVGKSTMLKNTLDGMNYISMDRPLLRQSAKENPSIFFDLYKPPIIVDEIQKAAELFEYIKDDVDQNKEKGKYYLTGSQSLKLMKNVSDSLAGRAGIIRMLGLSLREITKQERREPFLLENTPKLEIPTSKGLAIEEIARLIHKGFYPELYEYASDLKDWADFYSSYFQTYIEKDIKDVLNIKDEYAFIRFVRAAASLTGQLLNYATIAEICGKDIKTVKSWFSVLESSGLVYIIEPYYNNLNKRMTKTPKIYFLDTGLVCWLLGWNTFTQMINGAMWGNIFETFVFAEILKSFYNDGITNPPLFFYRDRDKSEIDLIIENGCILHPIEIKTSSDPSKSMIKAFSKLDAIPQKKRGTGYIICLAKEMLPLDENNMVLPASFI